ncbi:MAG TPA: Holliday junction resolvase RuvX [Bacteroidales bacterium]|nr:Holliday junction resolvase RuvX [Bacteroidales bacterium]
MGRIVAIDYGKKRTGIAVTDPARIIATPLVTVRTSDLEKFLMEYTEREIVDSFVIGYPAQLNNEPSEMVKYIDPFINRVKKIFPGMDIHLVDERFTSSIAKRAMIEGGMKKKDRQNKGNIDRISASLILQSFLEQQKAK